MAVPVELPDPAAKAAARPAALSPRMAWALALTGTFTMSVSYVDRQTLSALAPTVTKKLAIDETHYGLLVSAFSIAYLVGAPLAGRLIDAVGARRGLLGAVLVWSVVAAMHALVPDIMMRTALSGFVVLFALRIALGLAEAPTFPGAAQTVQRALPPSERARGLGILYTGSSFGAMVAPPLASYLEHRFQSWEVAFLGTAMVGLIWVPIWLLVAWSKRARPVMDLHHEKKVPPLRLAELLGNVAVWRGVALIIACVPLLGIHIHWLSKFLERRYHTTQLEIGSLLILPSLIFDVGAVLFGSLASRAQKRRPESTAPPRGLMTIAVIVAMTGVFLPLCPNPLSAMILAGVSMAGGGGMFALNTADVLRRVPANGVSTAGGIMAAAQSLALIVSSPLVGQVVEWTGSYGPILLAFALFHLPGVGVWLLVRPGAVTRDPA